MTEAVAVVTGAASGVGAETVRLLIESGIQVVGLDLSWPDSASVEGLERITGSVDAPSSWRSVEEVLARHRQCVRHLVINAAKLVVGPILDLTDEDIRSTLDINLHGAILALRTCLPQMLDAGSGSVVAVASVDALFAEQNLAAYGTSKGALLQLMRSVAVDYGGAGIRANSVCPGAIDTPFFRQHVESAPDPVQFLKAKIDRHPSGRILQPGDVANAVRFLLSDAAVGINGTHLVVDGGLTATFDYAPRQP